MKTRILRKTTFACFGLAVACQSVPAYASDLTGMVKDVCGRAIPGTRVTLTGRSGATFLAFTDGTGRYVFAEIAPGAWNMVFELRGPQKQQEDIQVMEPRASVERDVRLQQDFAQKESLTLSHSDPSIRYRKYSVHGTVTGPEGTPISNATVSFRVGDSTSSRTIPVTDVCATDELGRYYVSIWSPTSARWTVSVGVEGYAPYSRGDLEVGPDEPQAIEIRLQAR
jgi:hypothetical protein